MKRAPVDLLRKAIEAAQILKNTGFCSCQCQSLAKKTMSS